MENIMTNFGAHLRLIKRDIYFYRFNYTLEKNAPTAVLLIILYIYFYTN